MKNFAYSILGCLLLSLNAAFAQKTWSFDGQDPLLSCDGKSLLNLYTIKEIPEFVTGVEGKALRTDGYSTWMDTTTEGDVSSLSGWFALESYPTDTAAFMGIRDMAGTSVAVCVDRYGELLLGMGQNGSYSYCSLKTKVDRFKWLHVVLDLSNESVCLNGQRMSAEVWPRNLQDGEMMFRVGKDFREKKVWMYDVTAINGLIDGISLTPFSDDSSAWRDEIALGLKRLRFWLFRKPVLRRTSTVLAIICCRLPTGRMRRMVYFFIKVNIIYSIRRMLLQSSWDR